MKHRTSCESKRHTHIIKHKYVYVRLQKNELIGISILRYISVVIYDRLRVVIVVHRYICVVLRVDR